MFRKRTLSPGEKAEWRKIARSVKPMDESKARALEEDDPRPAAEPVKTGKKPAPKRPARLSGHPHPPHHHAPVPVDRIAEATDTQTAVISGKCSVFDPAVGSYVPGYRYDRDTLEPGRLIQHSGKITEAETTIIIPKSRQVVIQPDGCIDMTLRED